MTPMPMPMPTPPQIRRAAAGPPTRGPDAAPARSRTGSRIGTEGEAWIGTESEAWIETGDEARTETEGEARIETGDEARIETGDEAWIEAEGEARTETGGAARIRLQGGCRMGPRDGGRGGSGGRPGADIRTEAAGHLGEFLQGLLGPGGPVALVTLPAAPLRVAARLVPGPFGLHCAGPRALDRGRAAALCRAVTGRAPFGRLVLRAGMPAGGGAGSSTAALLAAAGAWALACGRALPGPERLARLCLGLEGATDPLMHPEPARLLWASRRGRVLAVLPPPPALEAVGGFLGAGDRTDPADRAFADVSDLAAAWAPAAARGDPEALGRIATESARRNRIRRGGPDLDPLLAAAARHGAVGIVAAHTGAARGLIFAPGRGEPGRAAETLRGLGLTGLCRFGLAGPAGPR